MTLVVVFCNGDLCIRHSVSNGNVHRLGGTGRNHHRDVVRHDAIGDVVVPFDIIEDQSQKTRWVDDGGLVCGQILDLNLPSEEDELGLELERAGDLVRKGVVDGGRHSWS
jgi:hypothetical protein